MLARDIGLWVGTVLVAPAVVALLIKLILPRRKLLLSGRAILFLIVTLALGPGAAGQWRAEGALGPLAADRRRAVRRA